MRLIGTNTPDLVVSVSRLATYITKKLTLDPRLRRIGVSGEISGLSIQPNGTAYFDLKDRDALIRCIAWSEVAASLPLLANGQAVIAIGSVSTYPKRSTYQLTVYGIELEGAGRLHAVYEALKRRLAAEGLFASERKRPLPAYPFRIALVSSRTANGAGDFLSQAAELAPQVTIELFETPVQGANAAPEIVRAIDRASRAAVDLVVIARGGGSYEDLFVFSDERVVRAVARCGHPTVSAIGHEADAPLTDFVADARAATPSTAAQTVLPRRADVLQVIAAFAQRLVRAVDRNVVGLQRELERCEFRSPLGVPERFLLPRRQAVDLTAMDLQRAVAARLRRGQAVLAAHKLRLEACNPSVRLGHRRERLAMAAYRLGAAARQSVAREGRRITAALARLGPGANAGIVRRTGKLRLVEAMLDGRDPTKILQRGYAIVTVGGLIARDADTVLPGALLSAQLARGTLTARVEARAVDGGE
jgi:exodeoxyribonuclease VII large subunit